MPGSVSNAVIPTAGGHPLVFPFGPARSFEHSRAWLARGIEYHDGTFERMALVSSSRRTWKLMRRLVPADLATLRTFLMTYPTAAFYFYDPMEPASGQPYGSNYDPTGASTQGRYKARVGGDSIDEQIFIPRTELSAEIVETA